MADRFFCDQPIQSDTAVLTEHEAHHLLHVLRAKLGDVVTLFDGQGDEYDAQVTALGRRQVELKVLQRHPVDRELPYALQLAVALPKGERQQWMVQKLVELGATRLIPLQTMRGVAVPTGKSLSRLKRAVVEACKQCGRNRLMEIAPACDLSHVSGQLPEHWMRLLLHPAAEAQPMAAAAAQFLPGSDAGVVLAVGPEGGWAPEEVETARQAGWTCARLGEPILRIETAALAAAALFALLPNASRGPRAVSDPPDSP